MVTGGSEAGGSRAVERCDMLGMAPYSDDPHGLFRGYLMPAYIEAQRAVGGWMAVAGMAVRMDTAGNLIGCYAGSGEGPALIIGSHLDSVRNGGRYDGPLGILLGIEAVAALHSSGQHMPFPIEVYAFGDEEGSRFPAAMLTSRAVAGTLNPAALDVTDDHGVTLDAALRVVGLDVACFADARHPPALAYLEAHIEQGPVLEAEGLAVATVAAIAAQRRYAITVTGQAGHAGTHAMSLRRDALAASAEMIGAAEAIARAGSPDLVATVGRLDVVPGAANVVSGLARFTLDVRAGDDPVRDAACLAILDRFHAIASTRGVELTIAPLQDLPASPCAPWLMALLDQAVEAQGLSPRRIVSGAGHDAMVMASLCQTAMLFIRCKNGISHHPDESVDPADAEVALAVMLGFIERLGEHVRG